MKILEILERSRLEPERSFLVIGGYAVNAHGYSRQTVDLDILIQKEQREFWRALLISEGGYELLCERDNFLQFSAPQPGQMPVDFMLVNESTFRGMKAEAVEGTLGGVKVSHPSLRHLIALKLHVIKQALSHRELKDLYDVIQLVHVNKVDAGGQEFRQLCERYGNSKAYEAIVRATR